jgi:hypothetical protein
MRMAKDKEVWEAALKTAEEQYQACETRLNALDVERTELLEEMKRLEQAISAITPLTTEHPADALNRFLTEFTPEPDGGLADAIRQALISSQRYMTAIEIRDMLEASQYDLNQHSNPLASIHGILKRFEDSGEVSIAAIGSKSSYRIAARKPSFGPPRRRLQTQQKPMPEWYKQLVKNSEPLNYSSLTRKQQREARELGLVKPDAYQELMSQLMPDTKKD